MMIYSLHLTFNIQATKWKKSENLTVAVTSLIVDSRQQQSPLSVVDYHKTMKLHVWADQNEKFCQVVMLHLSWLTVPAK